jgi:hypothetical protein
MRLEFIVNFFNKNGCPGQFVRTLTNLTGSEVNDYVNLQ